MSELKNEEINVGETSGGHAELPDNSGYSAIEQDAIDHGWQPKEDFLKNPDNDPNKWRSAKDFLEFGELFQTINSLKKELKGQKEVLRTTSDLIKKREQLAREQALEEFKKSRREAIESGDVDEVENLDNAIDSVKREINDIKKQPTDLPPEVYDFKERNSGWFNKNSPENTRMVNVAISLEQSIAEENPNFGQTEVLNEVEREMQKMFPHRFQNSRKNKGGAVESNTATPVSRKSAIDHTRVDDNLREIARQMVKAKLYKTEDDYIKEYLKSN